jgi:hypothetical protein
VFLLGLSVWFLRVRVSSVFIFLLFFVKQFKFPYLVVTVKFYTFLLIFRSVRPFPCLCCFLLCLLFLLFNYVHVLLRFLNLFQSFRRGNSYISSLKDFLNVSQIHCLPRQVCFFLTFSFNLSFVFLCNMYFLIHAFSSFAIRRVLAQKVTLCFPLSPLSPPLLSFSFYIIYIFINIYFIFSHKGDLKYHVKKKHPNLTELPGKISKSRTQVKDKPFCCTAPGCKSGYSRERDLKRHLKIKHGQLGAKRNTQVHPMTHQFPTNVVDPYQVRPFSFSVFFFFS